MSYNHNCNITPGDTITYKLRPDQRPINRFRVYTGKVERVYSTLVLVTLTDEEYAGLQEHVFYDQIVTVLTHAKRNHAPQP